MSRKDNQLLLPVALVAAHLTKRVKQGKARLAPPFDELAAWIGDTWGVTVLNVIYDARNKLHGPRLQVILEHEEEADSFRDGYNFDRRKEQAIAARFREIVNRSAPEEYDFNGLFVVCSAFAPIAREEADSKISDQEIAALRDRIGNPDLWVIYRSFGPATFMFYTDAQANANAAAGKKEEYARMYLEILKPYDEFGYISEENFAVRFDSKQNFDEGYGGSWFYYDK